MQPEALDPTESLPSSDSSILLVGFAESLARELRSSQELDADVWVAADTDQALELLTQGNVAVLCVGDGLSGESAKLFLEQALGSPTDESEEAAAEEESAEEDPPGSQPLLPQSLNIVLSTGPDLELFADFIAQDQLYYLSQSMPRQRDLLDILRSALAKHLATNTPSAPIQTASGTARTQRILKLLQRLATEPKEGGAARLTAEAATELTQANRAYCLLYDRDTDVLWTPQDKGTEERRESAAAGLVSFVLRTGMPAFLPRIGEDPRYEPEADNDSGPADERFAAVPVAKDGRVLAVLVALRKGSEEPFGPEEQRQLEALAEQAAPYLGRFALERDLDAMVTQHGALGSQAADIFRREALEHHARGLGDRGNVLEISPAWTHLTYKLLLVLFVAALIYSLVGSIYEYASGVAVIRVSDREDVTAPFSGTVVEVEVATGQEVREDQLLVRFYGAQELANLTRMQKEFEVALAQRLRNPSDLAAERVLASLRAQKEQAETRLEELSIRAPKTGIISDLRIRPGQHLVPGQVILSLVDEDPELEMLAIFPGQYRPQIKRGMELRMEPTGYRYAYQHLRVGEVSEEVVGPSEARRMLGPGIGDAVALSGPVVFVRARLPESSFESDGKIYQYHDGMQGLAEVRIRRERILITLIPGLKGALSDRHG